MRFLADISIRARFRAMIGIVAVAMLTTAVVSLWADRYNQAQSQAHFALATTAIGDAGALREATLQARRLEATMMAVGASNIVELERIAKAWKQAVAETRRIAERIGQAMPGDAAVQASVTKHAALLGEYVAVIEPIAQQLQRAQIDNSAALAYAAKAGGTLAQMQAQADSLSKAQLDAVAAARASQTRSDLVIDGIKLALMGVTLALFVPLALWTLRSVCTPVDRAVGVAERIAEGDLGGEVPEAGRDEIGRLMHAVATMQQRLRSLVGEIRQSADSIQVASTEVASGNTDLSQRTEQTASNLQNTASAMEQLTGTVRQSAESAAEANRLAASAAEVAMRGGQVVQQVVTTMDAINASSKQISDIIGVIDGIAFQTNILALNAAVEAARAGEQGRGFAVVASEVRGLAQRSAAAAKEIKALIGNSVDQVKLGGRLVTDAGSTMREIVTSAQRVSDIIGEISSASREQSTGLEQINGSVAQLDQMTQQNAALVEQSTAAAESLKDQAARLAEAVAMFRVDGGARTATLSRPASSTGAALPKSTVSAPSPAPTLDSVMSVTVSPATADAPAAAQPVARPDAASQPSAGGDDWESF